MNTTNYEFTAISLTNY